mgnify:CR=1 FL=1
MNKIKNTKGITLISLVITIIVLLILAGVSIAMLTGKNGLITRAQDAAEETRGASVEEERDLWKANQALDEYTSASSEGLPDLINRLVKQGLLKENEKDQILGNEEKGIEATGQVTIGSKTIVFGTVGKTLVQAFIDNEIKVGDYITNYNTTLNNANAEVKLTTEETGFNGGTQTYKVNANTTWRVLGLNEDKTQLIITTGSPIKKEMDSAATEDWKKDPCLYLAGAEGWYNTNDELVSNNILDKVCGIYAGKYASTTKSMRIEDINLALGLTLDKSNNKLYKTADTSKTEIAEYEGSFGTNYTYKIGDCAPENYLKAKYPTKYTNLTNKEAGNSVAGTAFDYEYTSANIVDKSSKLYEVLFDGTERQWNGKWYWLASSGVDVRGSDDCYFGPGAVSEDRAGAGGILCYASGGSREVWRAVRPVVYLQSGVTVDDLTVSSSGSEEEWDYDFGSPFPS